MKRIPHLVYLFLFLCGAFAACSAPGPSAEISNGVPNLTRPGSPADPVPTTQAPAPEPPVPAADPAPPAAPDPIVPGSANDPWGPILCPSLPHPAHHYPCPVAAAPTGDDGAPAPPGWSGGDTSGIDIVCESGGDYGKNTGNGYYGAYQWLPSTFRSALGEALAQGRITVDEYKANVAKSPDKAAPQVQDTAAAAHVAAGHRGAWPNC